MLKGSAQRRTPSRRTSALGQNKDDLERVRVNDDDSAISQHEILIGFVSWDDLDDTRWQTTQSDPPPRDLDAHRDVKIDVGNRFGLLLLQNLSDFRFLFNGHILDRAGRRLILLSGGLALG